MSFLDEVKADLEALGAKIESAVGTVATDALSDAETFVKSLAQSIETNGGAVLVSAAEAAVAAAETAGGSPAVKFAAAFTSVVSTLKTQGLPVLENAINGAIEAALANQRALDAAQAVPAPEPSPTVTPTPAPIPTEAPTSGYGA
jgi:hypothetical protein